MNYKRIADFALVAALLLIFIVLVIGDNRLKKIDAMLLAIQLDEWSKAES